MTIDLLGDIDKAVKIRDGFKTQPYYIVQLYNIVDQENTGVNVSAQQQNITRTRLTKYDF